MHFFECLRSSIIQEKFFESPVEHIFGIGLGSAIDNQFPFLDTSFFNKYRYLNFNWFSFQNLFLQTGWLGIILYVSFFGSLLIYNLRNKYKAPAQYRYLYDITITITLICILTIWYNATLRIFYATVPYVVLGLGPCVTHELVKRKKKNKVWRGCVLLFLILDIFQTISPYFWKHAIPIKILIG